MKKKVMSLLCASLIVSVSMMGASNVSAAGNDSDVTKLSKNGRLMKSLDGNEVGKALAELKVEGNLQNGKESIKSHYFDDGSKITVTSSVTSSSPFSVAPEVTEGGGGGGVVRDVTGTTTYSAYSWTGLKMWSYTLNQRAKVNGSYVTWYEPIPYTSYNNSLLSYWHVDSEALGVSYQSGGNYSILAMANAKFSFGFKDFVSVQSWNLKGSLVIYSTGSYSGSWTKL